MKDLIKTSILLLIILINPMMISLSGLQKIQIKDQQEIDLKKNNINYADSDNGKIKKNSNSEWNDYDSNKGRGNSKISTETVQKAIHALQKVAGNEQEVITKVTSEYMTQVKFAMVQAHKVWTAAAAWSSGVHKESVEYAQAVGESAAEQFYTNMESL